MPQSNPALTLMLLVPAFAITNGFDGGACPAGERSPPFAPKVTIGSENNDAGAYTPLQLRIERNDGEQEIRDSQPPSHRG